MTFDRAAALYAALWRAFAYNVSIRLDIAGTCGLFYRQGCQVPVCCSARMRRPEADVPGTAVVLSADRAGGRVSGTALSARTDSTKTKRIFDYLLTIT